MSTTTSSKPGSCQMPLMPAEHAATQKVGDRLVELCTAGKYLEAMKELYADNARHVEVMEWPGCARITEGKPALIQKGENWKRITTVHSESYGKAIVNGDQFVVAMSLDCTSSEGPMANQRMNISETALYTVRHGKITEARFFYACGM